LGKSHPDVAADLAALAALLDQQKKYDLAESLYHGDCQYSCWL
jgi:hypothetical protein